MSQEDIFLSLLYEGGNVPVYFQLDGAPSYFSNYVCQGLDRQLLWLPDAPNLSHLIFTLKGRGVSGKNTKK